MSRQMSHLELTNQHQNQMQLSIACEKYFMEAFKHIPIYSDVGDKYIKREYLTKLLPVEGIISERIFNLMKRQSHSVVGMKDLISFAKVIYSGSLEARIALIFSIYDYDGNGKITKEEVRRILSYIPTMQEDSEDTAFNFFLLTQKEIIDMTDVCFNASEELNYEGFKEVTQVKCSDMFYTV